MTKEQGIVIAAESEQATYGTSAETGLRHDFEKLLYVYAPIRLLICKARHKDYQDKLIKELTAYAGGCCQHFNPGAVFLLHFGM